MKTWRLPDDGAEFMHIEWSLVIVARSTWTDCNHSQTDWQKLECNLHLIISTDRSPKHCNQSESVCTNEHNAAAMCYCNVGFDSTVCILVVFLHKSKVPEYLCQFAGIPTFTLVSNVSSYCWSWRGRAGHLLIRSLVIWSSAAPVSSLHTRVFLDKIMNSNVNAR